MTKQKTEKNKIRESKSIPIRRTIKTRIIITKDGASIIRRKRRL